MARLFTTGFEDGGTREWTSVGATTPTFQTTGMRSGARCLQFGNAAYVEKVLPSTYTELYFRFGLKTAQLGANTKFLVWYKGATELGSLRYDADGTISMYTGTGTKVGVNSVAALAVGNWYLVEFYIKFADAGGVMQTKIDGNAETAFNGDTKPGTDANIDRFRLTSANNCLFNFDDVGVNDTAGGADNSWLGEGKVIALVPNGVGNSTQWTPSAAVDNYTCVDEIPANDDTDYVYQSSASGLDLYDLAACGLSNVTILRVWPQVQAKKTSADAASLKTVLRTNSTDYEDSSAQALTTSYTTYKGDVRTTNPNTGVAWTTADLDALQVGVKGA